MVGNEKEIGRELFSMVLDEAVFRFFEDISGEEKAVVSIGDVEHDGVVVGSARYGIGAATGVEAGDGGPLDFPIGKGVV